MRLLDLTHPSLAAAAFAATGLALTGCSTANSATEPRTSTSASVGAVWVANEQDDSIMVLDPETGEAIATLAGIDAPHNVQTSATRDVVWVTGTGGVVGVDATGLFPVDAAPAGEHPAHVVEAGTGSVFVSAAGDGVVHQYDTSLRAAGTHVVGRGPHGMRVTRDGSLVAIANTDEGSVTLLDPVGEGRTQTVDVGASPIQVAVTENGSTVFVAVAGTREIVRIDAATATVTGRVRVSASPAQIWVTSDGTVLSADQGTPQRPGSTVSLIDGKTMTVTSTVPTGSGPHGLTVNPDETRAWVTNAFEDTVTVIDLSTATVVETLEVGAYPNGITYTEVPPTRPEHDPVRMILPHAYSHPAEGSGHGHGTTDDAAEEEGHGEHHGDH